MGGQVARGRVAAANAYKPIKHEKTGLGNQESAAPQERKKKKGATICKQGEGVKKK